MKIIKKTLAITLAFLMALSLAVFASAEEEQNALSGKAKEYAAAFEALGLIENAEKYVNAPQTEISKAEVCYAVANLLNLNDENAVSVLSEAGLTTEEGASSSVMCRDAAEIFAKALCYEILDKNSENNFKKLVLTYQNSLLKGTSGKNLTAEDFVKMLETATTLGAVKVDSYFENGANLATGSRDTLLYKYQGIYTLKAVVDGNDRTSLTSPNGCSAGCVKLDGTVFFKGNTDVDNKIGTKVLAYIAEDEGNTEEILAYVSEAAEELKVEGENIVSAKAYSLTYEVDGATETEDFSRYINVIYNGKMTDSLTKDILLSKSGTLRFIDNDGDGTYDVAIIENFVDYIVDSIDVEDNLIYSKNNQPPLSIDEKDCAITYSLTGENITRATFEKIVTTDDVLSVAKSLGGSGKTQVTVKIGFDKIDGKITGISYDDDTVTVGEKTYDLSYDYAKSGDIKAFGVGDGVRMYLNGLNRVCKIEAGNSDDGEQYGYLLGVEPGKVFSNGASFKIFDTEGNTVTMEATEKITFNGSREKARTVAEGLSSGGFKTQLVRYAKNADGELTTLKTAKVGKDDNKFSLDIIMNNARYYSDNNYMFATKDIDSAFVSDYNYDVSTYGVEYSVGPDAKMLYIYNRVSDGLVADKGLTWIDQLGSQVKVSSVHMYDISDCGIAGMAVVEDSTAVLTDYVNRNYNFTVVEKLSKAIDEEGMEYLKVTVWRERKQQEFKLNELKVTECFSGTDVETEYDVKDYEKYISVGDVLQVTTRGDEITAFRRVFTFTKKPNVPDQKTVYAEDGVNEKAIRKNSTLEPTAHDTLAIYGKAIAKDGVQTVMLKTTTDGGVEVHRIRRINPQQASMYKMKYTKGNECTVQAATYNDIVAGEGAGSLVLLHSRNAKIMDMIIIETN